MLITQTNMTVPAGSMLDPDITIDLARIQVSESRQDEVATVSPIKAPELLAEFNRSWRGVHDIISLLEKEKNKAIKEAEKRRAVVLLEVIPTKIKEKGHKDSADIRQAIIDLDGEYEILTDRVDQIKAAQMFMKGKLQSFENAFTSVKKIMGEQTFNYGNTISGSTQGGASGGTSFLRASTTEPTPPRQEQAAPETAPRPAARPGFGTAKFGGR